jgi:hypothetical protein
MICFIIVRDRLPQLLIWSIVDFDISTMDFAAGPDNLKTEGDSWGSPDHYREAPDC